MSYILVIEDDAQSSRMVAKLLERAGHRVEAAPTGEDGLTSAFQAAPDLILLDLGLPDLDGQTVAALIRQQPALEHIPLIAFTAWPEDTAHEMARAYGCDGVITKPLDTRTFAERIARFLVG
jgi:two-component system, cell cycle response regulator DivK